MKEKIKIIVLISILFSCIWLFVLVHLNQLEKQFLKKEVVEEKPVIILVEKSKDELMYEKQLEFFDKNSVKIAEESKKVSKKYNIPIEVIYAIITAESDGVNGAVSKLNCVGLTQVSEQALLHYNNTHNTDYTLVQCRYDITVNLEVGIWYYSWCTKQVKGCYHLWENAYLMFNVGYGYYNKFYSSWIKGVNPFNNSKYSALDRFNFKLNESFAHFNLNIN